MDEWDFDDDELWEDEEEYLDPIVEELADTFFLSDDSYLPTDGDLYNLGHLEADDWWPLVRQLNETVDLEEVIELAEELDALLQLPGLPTQLLESPLGFLQTALAGNLPPQPSGRRVGSRKLVRIAQTVIQLARELPEAAQAAVRAWAGVHRSLMAPYGQYEGWDEERLAELLSSSDLPPAMTGFTMMIAMTLMRWPERAAGLPLPPDFSDPRLYDQTLAQWQALPETPTVTAEGEGVAEALFAQAQLAHLLAQAGSAEELFPDDMDEEAITMTYSRLSRAILWMHGQCRRCPEREGITCKVATNWPERPVPLLDVAAEVANTGRIEGCIKMDQGG